MDARLDPSAFAPGTRRREPRDTRRQGRPNKQSPPRSCPSTSQGACLRGDQHQGEDLCRTFSSRMRSSSRSSRRSTLPTRGEDFRVPSMRVSVGLRRLPAQAPGRARRSCRCVRDPGQFLLPARWVPQASHPGLSALLWSQGLRGGAGRDRERGRAAEEAQRRGRPATPSGCSSADRSAMARLVEHGVRAPSSLD